MVSYLHASGKRTAAADGASRRHDKGAIELSVRYGGKFDKHQLQLSRKRRRPSLAIECAIAAALTC